MIAAVVLVTSGLSEGASMPPITFSTSYSAASGGSGDQLLSPGALTNAALAGLRESGLPVVINAPEAMGWTPPHLSASERLNWSFDTTS
jgi:hypothetical protein